VDLNEIRRGFSDAGFPDDLVDEVLDSYVEVKRRFHLGDHRPQAVEGGRFSEGVFRMLQHATTGKYTALGKSLPTVDRLLTTLENASGERDAIRLHVPRTTPRPRPVSDRHACARSVRASRIQPVRATRRSGCRRARSASSRH
jgi:hypothetical protein